MATIPEHDLQEIVDSATLGAASSSNENNRAAQMRVVAHVCLLWNERDLLFKSAICGFVLFTIIAFLIPKQYQSTTELMPPDDQANSGMAMAAALAGKMSGGLSGLAGDVLGLKSSGDLFIGILRSRTVRDDLINKYDLKKVYATRQLTNARQLLAENTSISEDRKSGIITITVTDKNPQRAAALAQEYVSELNIVVSQLSTSSARRERVFLEDRLNQVKQDLEAAEKDFSEFSSKNATLDIKEQGRAMVDAASSLQGQLIAVQSELEGLKQIYSDNNVRIRSLKARAAELQNQLNKLGGKADISADATNPNDDSVYPSIRRLPLLGVTYADLYRRSKVQEAVYESLTQEYELAKVAEAREIPSVKVLDAADVPERKSYPPRLAIMVGGTLLVPISVMLWIIGKYQWEDADSHSPYKIFAQEIFNNLWNDSQNHAHSRSAVYSIWNRLVHRNDSTKSHG